MRAYTRYNFLPGDPVTLENNTRKKGEVVQVKQSGERVLVYWRDSHISRWYEAKLLLHQRGSALRQLPAELPHRECQCPHCTQPMHPVNSRKLVSVYDQLAEGDSEYWYAEYVRFNGREWFVVANRLVNHGEGYVVREFPVDHWNDITTR